jgi:Fur family ferric uptake transcriptional regulator
LECTLGRLSARAHFERILAMEKVTPFDTALATLNSYLLEHGMRRTLERTAILRAIYDRKVPFTAEEIRQEMENTFRVSLATVYHSIDLFLRLGLVTCHTFGSTLCYEPSIPLRDHFYQVCVHCGTVTRVESEAVTEAISQTRFRRLHVASVALCAYGTCSRCQAAITKAHNRYLREKEKAAAKKK